MKNAAICVWLCVLGLLYLPLNAAEQRYLFISYYTVGKNADHLSDLNERVTTNAVLRIEDREFKHTFECFNEVTGNESAEMPCPRHWRSFASRCKDQLKVAIDRTRIDPDGDPDHHLDVGITRINSSENFALVVRDWFGGTGGMRYKWNLYKLNQPGKAEATCPSEPFLSGVELVGGASSWVDSFCKKGETYGKCTERIFYPKNNAYRIDFTSAGEHRVAIQQGEPNPGIPDEWYPW